MHWKTAHANMRDEDGSTLTHLHTGTTIAIPPSWTTVRLFKPEPDTTRSEVALPFLPFAEIERMIQKAGISCYGWVPGYHRPSDGARTIEQCPYHKSTTYRAILTSVRLLMQERGYTEVAVPEVQAKSGIDVHLFCVHLMTLIEDRQGLMVGDSAGSRVRLTTWREAVQASSFFIEERAQYSCEAVTNVPKIVLRVGGGINTEWTITAHGDDCFQLFQTKTHLPSVQVNADGIDHWLKNYRLPSSGWAATCGEMREQQDRQLASQ